jgi:hypothetical protein
MLGCFVPYPTNDCLFQTAVCASPFIKGMAHSTESPS